MTDAAGRAAPSFVEAAISAPARGPEAWPVHVRTTHPLRKPCLGYLRSASRICGRVMPCSGEGQARQVLTF
eukprot:2742721-Amphidinium_carterae.1